MEANANIWTVTTSAQNGESLVFRYAVLGAEHIFFGLDHLAFLLTLLLLVKGLTRLAIAITGFTIGHSISLILTVLGYTIPNVPMIEALIGPTIALVAAEVVFTRQRRIETYCLLVIACTAAITFFTAITGTGPIPLAILGVGAFYACYLSLSEQRTKTSPILMLTILFGFIHGFGFAASLLDIGLPTERLAVSLLVFNLGIEAAQLICVIAVLVATKTIRDLAPRIASINIWQPALASALAGVGLFWFVVRAWG